MESPNAEPKWKPTVLIPRWEFLWNYGHYHKLHPEGKHASCALVLYSALFRYVWFVLNLCVLIDLEGY